MCIDTSKTYTAVLDARAPARVKKLLQSVVETDMVMFFEYEMAKHWLAGSGRDPGKMLMIGDTVHDLHVAEEIGVDCILIYSGHMSRTRLEATGARVIDRLEEIEF